jgi:hypothetical protein
VAAALRRPDPLARLLVLPGVDAAAGSARDAVNRLLAHRVLRRQSARVSTESALRGARASAALDGADVPLSAVRDADVDDPVVRGALRVTAGLGDLVRTWERAPLQVLARLHVLAAAGQVAPDRLGRPSTGHDATARLDALASLVAGGSTAPAVLVAAVVHAELRSLAPFGWGDGLVARAAARLTIVSRGLDPKAVSVPEVGHLEERADYEAALQAYMTGTPDGVAAWLRHCCLAVELGAREGLAICEAAERG